MQPEVIAALVGALAVGVAIGALLGRRRVRQQSLALTLVPHRTRQVLSALQSAAILVRRDRRAGFSNNAAHAMGLARPDGALSGAIADVAETAWEAGEPVEREIEVRRGVLGAVSQVHLRVTPVSDDLALALANDNTRERVAEMSRREFAANVSHELKTPIGAMSLLAESIHDAPEDTEMVGEFSAKIVKEARRLTKLIQEIIQISRLQAGSVVTEYQEVALADVIEEAVEAASLSAESRGIEIVTSIESSPIVMGDADLLVMAVRNLVDNAVNYSQPHGKVTVTLQSIGRVAHLAVLDRGIGIEVDEQERIFERFYRTDPARSRETGGTGLGLSIVKHVAQQHAGEVAVWSRPGVGSTFTLRLSIHRED